MIASENDSGDMLMKIDEALFDLVAEYLGTSDRGAMCCFLEKLSVRAVVRLERLAPSQRDLARDYLKRTAPAGNAAVAKPSLKLI
jgi:hypothetical protein